MSRSFIDSGKRIVALNYSMPTTGSLSIWFYPNFVQADGQNHMIFNFYKQGNWEFGCWKWSDNQLYNGWYPGGEQRVIVSNANYTINQYQWNLLLYTWDASDGTFGAYLNDTTLGTRSSGTTPFSGPGNMAIGAYTDGSYQSNCSIAHAAIYTGRKLSAEERTALYKGAHPLSIRGIYSHWEIIGIFDPEPDSNTNNPATVYASPARNFDPPIEYRTSVFPAYQTSEAVKVEGLATQVIQGADAAPVLVEGLATQVIQGADAAPILVEGLAIQVISAYDGSIVVSELLIEPVIGQSNAGTAAVTEFLVEIVQTPWNVFTYGEAGNLILDGITSATYEPVLISVRTSQALAEAVVGGDGADMRISQSLAEAVVGGAGADLRISQSLAEVIVGGVGADARISQFLIQAIVAEGQWRWLEAGNLILDGITTARFQPGIQEWHYDEAGEVIFDGIVSTRRVIHYSEAGNLIFDGITDAHPTTRYAAEAGNVIFDGITDSVGEVSNKTGVSQVSADFVYRAQPDIAASQVLIDLLLTMQPDIASSQVLIDLLLTTQPPIGISQVDSEFLEMTIPAIGPAQIDSEFYLLEDCRAGIQQVAMELLVANWKKKDNFMPTLTRLME